MNYDGTEVAPTSVAEIVGVINAATTVVSGVSQHNDMFVGRTGQHIV